MADITVQTYNKLHSISCSHERFIQQLKAACITQEQLFSELALFFQENDPSHDYALCLIHRHYSLNEGEKMVSNGDSIAPSMERTPNIIPERWFSNGDAMEYTYCKDLASQIPPPSPEFFAKFHSIVSFYNIDTLGVCYMSYLKGLATDWIYLECSGTRDREQVVKIVPQYMAGDAHTYSAIWIPIRNPSGMIAMRTCASCASGQPGCKPLITGKTPGSITADGVGLCNCLI